jgi:hypothetical protein
LNRHKARPETSLENARSTVQEGERAIPDVVSPKTIQDVSGLQNLDSTSDPLDVLRATLGDDDQGAEVIEFPLRRASPKR